MAAKTYSGSKVEPMPRRNPKPGDHICCFHDREEDYQERVLSFIYQGLKNGEMVLGVLDSKMDSGLRNYMHDRGLEPADFTTSGQLVLLNCDVFRRNVAVFNPERLIAEERALTEQALTKGYKALRVSTDMTWLLPLLSGFEDLINYEARTNEIFSGTEHLAICHYDRKLFDPSVLLKVLKTHPYVMVGQEIHENCYYLPPSMLFSQNAHEKELLQSLHNLEKHGQAEKTLKANEEKYRVLFEQSRDAIALVERQGKIVEVNQALVDLTGYRREELIGQSSLMMYTDSSLRSRLQREMDKEGFITNREIKFLKKGGSEIDCLITSHLLKDSGGENVGYQTIVRDVTESIKAEKKLLTERKILEMVTQNIGAGLAIISRDYRIIWANKVVKKLFGEMEGKICYSTYHGTTEICSDCGVREVLETGKEQMIYEHASKDIKGKTIWSQIIATPLRDEEGKITAVLELLVPITERKRAEEALEAKTRMNAMLLDGLPCIALLLKTGSREIMLSNRLGQNAGGSPGKECFRTWPNRETLCPWCLAAEAIASGKTQHWEIETIEGKAWDLYWIPLGPDQFIHYAFDITEKKRLEKQLIQAQKMEAIGQLAGGIAHDFNNILSGITGYTSLLKMKMNETSPFFTGISMIEKSAWRAAELVRQLLGFARGGRYELRQINLNHAVNNVLGLISETFDRAIAIHTDLTQDIGMVEGDAGQLEQVLLNICLNARDAMPLGGRLTIETGNIALDQVYASTHLGVKEGEYVLLAISDTGSGITPEIQEKIFEPFFTTKEIGKGTGLGLAMVYGIIRHHEGYISVDSDPERGSCFKIYLPVSKRALQEKAKPANANITTGSGTILLVDDEEIVRQLGKTILEELGYQVIPASDGQEACAIFAERKEQIDLVLLDMIMPGMGGKETYLKLKGLNSRIKVLFCSGDVLSGQVLHTLKEGVRGFIQKPFTMQQLAQSVSEALQLA